MYLNWSPKIKFSETKLSFYNTQIRIVTVATQTAELEGKTRTN
jgi:hypothetical protein